MPLLSDDYLATIAARLAAINLPCGRILDAVIAQATLNAGVDILLTLNPNHFTRLGEAIAYLVQVPQ